MDVAAKVYEKPLTVDIGLLLAANRSWLSGSSHGEGQGNQAASIGHLVQDSSDLQGHDIALELNAA